MSLSTHFPGLILNREYALLNKFSRMAWGHPGFLFRYLDDASTGPIEFIDLGEYFLAFQALFAGILDHPRVLVRDEYRTALDALQGDEYYRGACVIGHSGIGKSCTRVWRMLSDFMPIGKTHLLVYLIVHFLGQKQAVAFQLPRSQPFYLFFAEDGAHIQSDMDSCPLFNCTSFIWALCDDANLVNGSLFMTRPDRIRVVQTTAHVLSHWKSWTKQIGANFFIMDIWSTEEVRKLAYVKHVPFLPELTRSPASC